MSLNLTNPANAGGLLRLPDSMIAACRELAAATEAKKKAESEARAAESAVKAARAILLKAMGESQTAVCGNMTLAVKESADAPAALTLKSGSKVLWSTVTGVLCGNTMHDAADVAAIFGGRTGSASLTVGGA